MSTLRPNRTSVTVLSALLAGCWIVCWCAYGSAGPPPPASGFATLFPEDALVKARCNGKYAMLLQQFRVEKDREMYKDFQDVGERDVREYAGQAQLPKGNWVYVYPYWYIWRDVTAKPQPQRNWGPEQVIGEP